MFIQVFVPFHFKKGYFSGFYTICIFDRLHKTVENSVDNVKKPWKRGMFHSLFHRIVGCIGGENKIYVILLFV